MNQPVHNRFYSYVKKTRSCWLWTGYLNEDGYGHFNDKKKTYKAHRFAWQLENGSIPDGKVLRHRCRVRACVRLSHLKLGSVTDNNRDQSSLSLKQIKSIRGIYERECRKIQKQIMRNFPKTRGHLLRILRLGSWK